MTGITLTAAWRNGAHAIYAMEATLRKIILLSLTLILFSSLFSCTQLGPYRADPDGLAGDGGKLPYPEPAKNSKDCVTVNGVGYCAHIVEVDEFGNIFNRSQLRDAINAAKQASEHGGTVILYAHGWHHSGRMGDCDIAQFLRLLATTGKQADEKNVVGIYVAWRGDSIDSQKPLMDLPSNLLTFWNRKAAAHAIGNGGGVSELIRALSTIRSDSAKPREEREEPRLVLMGHSFGGAILYSSVSQLLAEQFRLDQDPSNAMFAQGDFPPLADLVVLLNPAFEAMRIAPLYSYARSIEYKEGLPVRLVIVTTKEDWPTRVAFYSGRFLATLFRSHTTPIARTMNRTAVGHYEPFITHKLEAVASPCVKDESLRGERVPNFLTKLNPEKGDKVVNHQLCFDVEDYARHTLTGTTILWGCNSEGDCSSEVGNQCSTQGSDCFKNQSNPLVEGKNVQAIVLTRCDDEGDCEPVTGTQYLKRGLIVNGQVPYRFPIANIRTTGAIMANHSDIWNDNITRFLSGLLEDVTSD